MEHYVKKQRLGEGQFATVYEAVRLFTLAPRPRVCALVASNARQGLFKVSYLSPELLSATQLALPRSRRPPLRSHTLDTLRLRTPPMPFAASAAKVDGDAMRHQEGAHGIATRRAAGRDPLHEPAGDQVPAGVEAR